MEYYFNTVLDTDFATALERTKNELGNEGFGILTDIDVAETLKKKLGIDFRRYRILGACNPPFALKALSKEDKVGTMLPCNVILQDTPDGRVEVAAIDPVASMQAVPNPDLMEIADQIRGKLKAVIGRL